MIYYYRRTSKALIVTVWISLTIPYTTASNVIKGRLPSLPIIADFLTQLIKPLLQETGPHLRSGEESFIHNIVNQKVKQLKNFLQDDEIAKFESNKLKLEGEHDTTILEIMPDKKEYLKKNLRNKNQKVFVDDIEKYKKLREKIKKALDSESISENTQDLLLTTLDEMIARVIGNQCSWKANEKKALRFIKGKVEPLTLANIWTELWNKVKAQIKPDFKSSKPAKSLRFLDHFQEFVSKVINDTQTVAKSHKFVCHLIDAKRNEDMTLNNEENKLTPSRKQNQLKNSEFINKPILREKLETDENNTCSDFKVCTKEITDFMVDVYTNINDTAVNTLRSYAEMFIRDVNTENREEKNTVVTKINDTSNDIEHKITVIFKKQTNKFILDENKDKDSNIIALNNYIKKTINHVKKQIMIDLGTNLKMLRPKLLTNIKKDIEVNLDVDLGNLERELSTKVCMTFSTCNSKYLGRRQRAEDTEAKHVIDRNSIYVKVQLTLDDKKHKIPVRRIGLNVGRAMRSLDNTNMSQIITYSTEVTRTTHVIKKKSGTSLSSLATVRDIHIPVIQFNEVETEADF